MKSVIYFDHNATMPIRNSVKRLLVDSYEYTGNTSSIHKSGIYMKRKLEASRKGVAELLSVSSDHLIWTSGATESNNTVLRGYNGPVIISSIEHPSIYDVRNDAIICPVDKNGIIDLNVLEGLLKQHSKALVCIMAANNETGVTQPLQEIISLVHKYSSFIFSDCAQAIGKIDVPYHELDGFSLSGHKIGTPYGIGALCIKPHLNISPLLIGGGQEHFKRAGTVNVYGSLAFAASAGEAVKENWEPVKILRDYFEDEMKKICPEIIIVSKEAPRLQNTSGIIIPGLLNMTQLMHYDLEGFCISSGAACSSGTIKTSYVLTAMGYPQELANCFIRISFGKDNTKEQINQFLEVTEKLHKRRQHA